MHETTDRPAVGTDPALTPECRLNECRYCQPGEVRTTFGDLVFTVRCAHRCHLQGGAG